MRFSGAALGFQPSRPPVSCTRNTSTFRPNRCPVMVAVVGNSVPQAQPDHPKHVLLKVRNSNALACWTLIRTPHNPTVFDIQAPPPPGF